MTQEEGLLAPTNRDLNHVPFALEERTASLSAERSVEVFFSLVIMKQYFFQLTTWPPLDSREETNRI